MSHFVAVKTQNKTIDSASGRIAIQRAASARMFDRVPVCSIAYARGKKTALVSFSGDTTFHDPYAVFCLGERALVIRNGMVDGVQSTRAISAPPRLSVGMAMPRELFSALERRAVLFGNDLRAGLSGVRLGIEVPDVRNAFSSLGASLDKAKYAPLFGAMALGMVSAVFFERSFGAGVRAGEQEIVYVYDESRVLGADTTVPSFSEEDIVSSLGEIASQNSDKDRLEKRIRELVSGYPIEEMVPYIMEQDRLVAIFLISIAKKESDWGRRVPVLDGQDCFNYWGYRGVRKLMGSGGHTCFNSRQDAVETVGGRLKKLIYENKLDTPSELILWKCGSSCDGHSSYSVSKWISDVDLYYRKLNQED